MTYNNTAQTITFLRGTATILPLLDYNTDELSNGDLITVQIPTLDQNGSQTMLSLPATFNSDKITFTNPNLTIAQTDLLLLAAPTYLKVLKGVVEVGGVLVFMRDKKTGFLISKCDKFMKLLKDENKDVLKTCDNLFYFKDALGNIVKVDTLDTVNLIGATVKEINGNVSIEVISTLTPLVIPVNAPALVNGQLLTTKQAIEILQSQISSILKHKAEIEVQDSFGDTLYFAHITTQM